MKRFVFFIAILMGLTSNMFSQVVELGLSYNFQESKPEYRIILFPENPIGFQTVFSEEYTKINLRIRNISKNKREFIVDKFRYILLGCEFLENEKTPLLNLGLGLEIVKWNGLVFGAEGNVGFKMNKNMFNVGLDEAEDLSSARASFSIFLVYVINKKEE